MTTINISVRRRIVAQTDRTIYVCGNSDYFVVFDFDDEWQDINYKTARFIVNGKPIDVVIEGNVCRVPVLLDAHCFFVGVFAGDLRTTTSARILARKSCLSDDGWPVPPPPDVYNQIMDKLNHMGGGMPDVDEVDALSALIDTGTVDPAADETGAVYVDGTENLYSF